MVKTKRNFVNNQKSQTGGGRGTVGQEAGELICQTEWKTRQKEVTALWTLLSSKLKCFSIRVTIKLSYGFFCFLCLVKGHFRLLGPKSACWMAKMATYRKIEGIPSFHQDMGEIWSNWVGSIWAPTSSQAPSYASESETTTYLLADGGEV